MKQLILLAFTALSLTACKEKKQDPTQQDTTPVATGSSFADDSTAIRKLVLDFYDWYTANDEQLMKFKLYSGKKKSDEPPYQLNWDQIDLYQAFIRDSVPYLGAAFLEQQRKMFKQVDSALKASPEDEIPFGFDYDWYTNSQEDPSYLLDGIKASGKWMLQIKGDDATLEIGAPEDKNYVSGSLLIFIGLKKENGRWTISEIGND